MRLVLASASPRRAVLLRMLVPDATVRPVDVSEATPRDLRPEEAIELIARKKALAGSKRDPDAMVLGCDTAIQRRGRLVGKPEDIVAARLCLADLSDARHQVFTGLALAHDGRIVQDGVVRTDVRFDRIPVDVFEAYLAAGSWRDKAGGYGIQEPMLAPFIHVDGSWSNVVGLPLQETAHLLQDNGIPCKAPPDEAWLRDHNPFDTT